MSESENKVPTTVSETVEEIAKVVMYLSEVMEKLRKWPLKFDTIVLLIQDAAGGQWRISKPDIKTVLNALWYLKKKHLNA